MINQNQQARSAQHVLEKLLPTTLLLKHLPVHTAETVSDDIRFLGQIFLGQDGEVPAVARLLTALDRALFFGNPLTCPEEFDGLLNMCGPKQWFADRAKFYAAVNDHPAELRLFSPATPSFLSEGDLPRGSKLTFAVGHDACHWKQLLPCTVIELLPVREGLIEAKDVEGINQPPELFKHEGSEVRARNVALLYGTLVVDRPEDVLVLNEGGGFVGEKS